MLERRPPGSNYPSSHRQLFSYRWLADPAWRLDPAERAEIEAGAQRLIAEARAFRLSEVRRRHTSPRSRSPRRWGVTQARVSRIEKGELVRSEVDTLAAYVQTLGGKLKIIADFGDETYVLG